MPLLLFSLAGYPRGQMPSNQDPNVVHGSHDLEKGGGGGVFFFMLSPPGVPIVSTQ